MKKILVLIILIQGFFIGLGYALYVEPTLKENEQVAVNENLQESPKETEEVDTKKKKVDITEWNLRLVNYENVLPDDFEIKLESIDTTRKFDARAIDYLFEMQKAMKKDGITNVWVQSAYRSKARQKELFDNKVNGYIFQGKSKEEAEKLALQIINRPGTSEHNLGLAVDFNYVDYSFDQTAGYKWLLENAEDYGFILRYRKDKEEITKVKYEPWHFRFVGIEHAKKINELDMCLEEYIELNSK